MTKSYRKLIFVILGIFILSLVFIVEKCQADNRIGVSAKVDPTLTFSLDNSYLTVVTNEDLGYYIALEKDQSLESLKSMSGRGEVKIPLKADLDDLTYLCLSVF